MQLPTDQEFLEQLMLEQCRLPDRDSSDAEAIADNAIAQKTWPAERKDDLVRLIVEGNSPTLMLQGYVTKALRSIAGHFLSASESRVHSVPVGVLATPELNAFAIRTPRGNAAIVLNVAVIHHMKIVLYAVLAITLRNSRFAFGLHHSEEEYLASIIEIREAVISGRGVYPCNIPVWDCVDDYSPPQETVIEFMLRTSLFVLLHEYGHVYCGHLNDDSIRPLRLGARELSVYSTSHRQEYEADEFAIRHLLSQNANDSDFAPAIVAGVGILFRFFDLCEGRTKNVCGTHPPSIDRWHRIKTISTHLSNDHPFTANIEAIFDGLLAQIDAQPCGQPDLVHKAARGRLP